MRVLISTGEASGDAYGAALAQELQKRLLNLDLAGTGGKRMREAGVRLVWDSSKWGAISIVQALKVVPRVLLGYQRLQKELASGRPGIFIPIDFGYVNIRLSRTAKKLGWKVLYLVPPGSWRRDRQGSDLRSVTDAIVTPFDWSAKMLNSAGAVAHWYGHPIKQLLANANLSAAKERNGIAILPGSRDHEIAMNLPIIAEALRVVDESATFALAPSLNVRKFELEWVRLSGRKNDRFVSGGAYPVLAHSRAAIVCSGTATLEAALCHCPMVVIYRVSSTMLAETKLVGFKRPEFIALPNILLQRAAVPELVQDDATSENLRGWVKKLLMNTEFRRQQLTDFEELDSLLGPADALSRTADLALEMLRPSP